ncbi:MAG: NapC/NirT family cytochrome c [Calditrichia bacterium]|nr:NapC/NirT family cytochrome c [Calditrichia bacterium]
MKLKLPVSTHNWISLTGFTVAVISLFMITFLFVISTVFLEGGSYLGLVIYIVLPVFMIIGLVLIPLGMLITVKRSGFKDKEQKDSWPKIDLNQISHRNAFFIFTIGTTLLLLISAVGSYEAFHFTESVAFCGTLCHDVMEPEHTAYQNSAHARVACVACHVGTGADWYVRSKISGMYQVYSVLLDKYQRPISVPIHNLRPARETCEQCHWPQKFYAQKLRAERHYLNDVDNTQWDIQLLMKIGAEQSAHGLKEGIHWHINPDIAVEYISEDDKNLSILWVRYTNKKTGEIKIYKEEDQDIDLDLSGSDNLHKMDCMDCHNRPSHNYRPPAFFVNEAITSGSISQDLPEIKNLSMEICSEKISDSDSAKKYIERSIKEFYESEYPEVFESEPEKIQNAIQGLTDVYFKNIFPKMNVRWDAYPNHIGHLEFDGCFRCHNDNLTNEDGDTIQKDCNLCHTIIAQGSGEEMQMARVGESLPFQHPGDITEDEWQESLCTDCHTGLNP